VGTNSDGLRCIQEGSESGICLAGVQSSRDASGEDIRGFSFGDERQNLRRKTGTAAGVLVSEPTVVLGEKIQAPPSPKESIKEDEVESIFHQL
jgi:hypothetical protein